MQKSVRMMWDLMRDVAVTAKLLPRPARPSFEQDIRPLFERMSRLQWVNAGFAAQFGWKGPQDFSQPEWLERLAQRGDPTAELRRTIANHFRNFDRDSYSPTPWPWLYGDAMNIPPAATPRQNAALTDLQLRFLDQWANGDFDADYACSTPSSPAWPPPKRPTHTCAGISPQCPATATPSPASSPPTGGTWRSGTAWRGAGRTRHSGRGGQSISRVRALTDTSRTHPYP
jgi:hypothetical protein